MATILIFLFPYVLYLLFLEKHAMIKLVTVKVQNYY